jgi:hypothetical protein
MQARTPGIRDSNCICGGRQITTTSPTRAAACGIYRANWNESPNPWSVETTSRRPGSGMPFQYGRIGFGSALMKIFERNRHSYSTHPARKFPVVSHRVV